MTGADTASTCITDVAVVGGGLAGLAAAIHLARDRRSVVCVDHRPWPRSAVGESLEFSAPKLLEDLGVDIDDGAEPRPVFPKTSVRVTGGGDAFTVWPPQWFARPPIWCSLRAVHADRAQLDCRLMHLAIATGVEMLPERVTGVRRVRDRITALITNTGTRIEASWFVDASGHTGRVFGRGLGLGRALLGAPRAAQWARFTKAPDGHATRLYIPDPDAGELTWAWEIPLNAHEISIGVVMSAARLSTLRRGGLGPRAIFEHQLDAVPRLRSVVGTRPDYDLDATTYTPYRHDRAIGPNWLLVGDASAMVDPLTSNGVTSALRHAEQAARTVSLALDRRKLGRARAWAYRSTAPVAVATIERAMETFLYEPATRRRLGLRRAVGLYAATGVITNSLYAKINPITVPRSFACVTLLAASRVWTRAAGHAVARLARRQSGDGSADHARGVTRTPASPVATDRW